MVRRIRTVVAVGAATWLAVTACAGDDGGAADDAAPTVAESTAADSTAGEPADRAPASPTTAVTDPPEAAAAPGLEQPRVRTSGPVTGGGGPATAARLDLASRGYVEEEFFVEGEATSYTLVGQRSPDGFWTAAPDATAPYRTRLIVRRPVDPASFSGVVLVEWLNVTAGADGDPEWGYTHTELLREGHAYVGVSAQAAGVNGGSGALLGTAAQPGGLVGADPERYGTLVHPGDAYAFDIFTQAGAALADPDGPAPLGELVPTTLIAAGESQSAFFLTTYLNAVHPLARVYDGFLVHSRGGAAPTLAGERLGAGTADPVRIRTDLDEPVLVFSTETDLTVLGYAAARQDDTDRLRSWEVAGTAHADAYLLEEVYGLGEGSDAAEAIGCAAPLNAGPHHEVLVAALHHLVRWIADGTPPPVAPRIELASEDPPVIARDADGNALGGIRTPLVDVPVATLSGDPVAGGSTFCFLFGSTTPFDAATIAARYPEPDDYLTAFRAAAEEAVAAGFLLEPDAADLVADAEALVADPRGPFAAAG